jgi:lysozyme
VLWASGQLSGKTELFTATSLLIVRWTNDLASLANRALLLATERLRFGEVWTMNKFEALLEQFKSQNRVLGVDVSHYQGAIDWQHVADQNPWLSFAIAKATDGTARDDQWIANARGITAAGLNLGCYAFFHPDDALQPQIDAVKAAMGDSVVATHVFLVDLEKQFKTPPMQVAQNVHVFVNAFADARPSLVYSYDAFLAQFGHALEGVDIAIAAYNGQPAPITRFESAELAEHTKLYQFAGDGGITLELQPGRKCVVDHDVVCDNDLAFYLQKVAK